MKESTVVGIDAGSVAACVVQLSMDGDLLYSDYRYHFGNIDEALSSMLEAVPGTESAIQVSTSTAAPFLPPTLSFDTRLCLVEGGRRFFPNTEGILDVGAEKFGLYLFNNDGSFRGLSSSTSCAAGTGGFLDQQARRLALSGSAELSDLASKNTGPIPKIASRCAVFAKTDIIHAQQEGYSLEQICDGLCDGLARTINDTLFTGDALPATVGFTGGVSRNNRVSYYIASKTGTKVFSHPLSHCTPAIGAALLALQEDNQVSADATALASSVPEYRKSYKRYYYEPLQLSLSDYPDFNSHESYRYSPQAVDWNLDVEIDIYRPLSGTINVFLGIDIGSTSTKAMILDENRTPLIGLYTRTSGRPLKAVQALFETVTHVQVNGNTVFTVRGAATTGSGRKFIGSIIGADVIIDEISAHALAACELDPDIDTIIEIGGQDSKFTRLRNGVVTFSQMNNVCAAGTGSFIEEQAERLNVPVGDISTLVQGASSPLASDRCTVFMERDINHHLSEGYRVSEILASVLHSIRENYLTKVASQSIGKRICFQGATAKNRALVASFEQKLGQPIFVSRYCHLTGAMGAALDVFRVSPDQSAFRGFDIYNRDIPIHAERCNLCGNHCRLRVADIDGKKVAFGFLCGRDYETEHFVSTERAVNFLKRRKRFLHKGISTQKKTNETIAVPLGLHLVADAHLWRHFFSSLGLTVIFIDEKEDPVGIGKSLTGAEFCAPMAAFHAHVEAAANEAEILFLPVYLDIRSSDPFPGKACYYTQFSVPVVKASAIPLEGKKIVSPVLTFSKGEEEIALSLHESLKPVYGDRFTPEQVRHAYISAVEDYRRQKINMIEYTRRELEENPGSDGFAVVLTGRPYTVLADTMNKGIPGAISSMDVPVLFQDMLDSDTPIPREYSDVADTFHWQYARDILRTAALCAVKDNLYPVFLTSFKCSPDSFVIEYFKRILDAVEKPYLILQLDEHDSRVGYETRIEAALRSFRNHFHSSTPKKSMSTLPVKPAIETSIEGKTLVFPNWDPLCIPLVAANLVHAGYDVRVLRENSAMIAESMRLNTGQCIPVNAIAHEYATFIREEGLDPSKTVLWMARSQWSCNIPVYPYFIKSLLEAEGGGLEHAGVYIGELTHIELSPLITVRAYFAYMFGGLLRKIGCALRPYETEPGTVDRVIRESHDLFLQAFRGDISFVAASKRTADRFKEVKIQRSTKPLVAIFGDIYVRDNPVMNQGLVHRIEEAGGEAVVTPYNEYVKIVAGAYFNRWKMEGKTADTVVFKTLLTAMRILERFYARYFRPFVSKPFTPDYSDMTKELHRYALDVKHEGESFENILKIAHILEVHPDLSLFVQTNPAFCCPSIITESMKGKIEAITGVPVVTITYDGTGADKNDVIVPYIRYGSRYRKTEEQVRRTRRFQQFAF